MTLFATSFLHMFHWRRVAYLSANGVLAAEDDTLSLLNIILVVAAALSVVKQYFIVTKVKLTKRTEYVSDNCAEVSLHC